MKIFNKNLKKEILYIAELGINHDGSFKRLKKLIKLAKDSGADVVKFQCFTPEFYVTKENEKYQRLKKLYFDEGKFNKIINFCKKLKINYLFTPLSHDWVKFLKKNSNTVKIASGDINFTKLIDIIISYKLNIILSTGIANYKEIKKVVNYIKKKYKKKIKNKLILLHCVSQYPVDVKKANILSVKFLKDKFKLWTGYSNHVSGIEACLAAIANGARIIEFHFTDNKKRAFRDHQLSLDKKDTKNLIKLGNNINLSLGAYNKKVDNDTKKNKRIFSKGLIAKHFIKKNTKLKLSDITFARPATYFGFQDLKKVIGKKVNKDVDKGYLLKKNNISKF